MSQGLEDVGNYLLETFYDNDIELYHSLKRNKHASLSLLEQRCETIDLPVSRRFLANAIGVAVMAKQLPRTSAFLKLPASHKQELLRTATPQKADALATKALEKKLTVQKLRAPGTTVQHQAEERNFAGKEAQARRAPCAGCMQPFDAR